MTTTPSLLSSQLATYRPELAGVLRFVRSHGWSATILNGKVVFGIPYSINGKHAGFETHKVATIGEARNALGY